MSFAYRKVVSDIKYFNNLTFNFLLGYMMRDASRSFSRMTRCSVTNALFVKAIVWPTKNVSNLTAVY